MLKSFSALPEDMQTDAVKPYYDALDRRRSSLIIKRGFDILAALILIALLSPALLIIAAMVKRSSEGPVFFRQVRITQYGRRFRIFKFRTMAASAAGSQVTLKDDPRITPLGEKLRARRLDELPQLFNVLTGDMSFVGTRPEVEKYVREYTGEMRATLLLPAGITSRASLLYKDESALLERADDADRVYTRDILPAKMAYNLEAIKNFSLLSDFQTMLATLTGALFGR